MPFYDYECDRCGPFTEMRPMAECELPLACRTCGKEAPRAYLTGPYVGGTSDLRLPFRTGARGAAGQRVPGGSSAGHGGGCGCCSGKSLRYGSRNRA